MKSTRSEGGAALAAPEREVATSPVVLLSEPAGFSPRALEILEAGCRVERLRGDRQDLLEAVAGADVLWVRLAHTIDDELLSRAGRLSTIVTPTTGLNHVDTEAAARRGVEVLSLRGRADALRDVRATAEHTVGLMLSLLRHVPEAAAHVNAGGWDRDRFRGRELHGATVGLVGFGRLGRIVARILLAFDAVVLAHDPDVSPYEPYVAGLPVVPLVPLDELLRRSDVVSVHAALAGGLPARGAPPGLIGARELGLMKDGAYLVNTARGELVDEHALLLALASGRLAGAALDVLSNETAEGMGQSPLVAWARTHPQLLITPHLGGCTRESMEKTEVLMAEALVAHLARSTPRGAR